jgi:hypothetical protein
MIHGKQVPLKQEEKKQPEKSIELSKNDKDIEVQFYKIEINPKIKSQIDDLVR